MIMQLARNLLIFSMLIMLSACGSFSLFKQDNSVNDLSNTSKEVRSGAQVILERNWSEDAVKWFVEGAKYLENDPDRSIKALNQAIQLEPEMEAAYFNLLRLYFQQGKTEKMLQILQKAKDADVHSPRLYTLIGSEQRRVGQFTLAEAYYLKALAMDKNYLTVLANMAILQDLYLHDLNKANNYYQQYQQQLIVQGRKDSRIINWLADLKRRLPKVNRETAS